MLAFQPHLTGYLRVVDIGASLSLFSDLATVIISPSRAPPFLEHSL